MTGHHRPWVVLVGPPGAGKTTVGRIVADRTGLGFRDTDADVEAAAGRSVADIFVEDGEEAFRALERVAVERALTEHTGVLALGGGAVLDAGTRARLQPRHQPRLVVFLDVTLTDAAHRVGFDTARPLLAVNPRSELKKTLDERRPIYTSLATATISTDGRTPEQVAEDVLAVLDGRR